MYRVDLKQSLLSNNRVDQFHDEMWADSGMFTEVVTASAGATTWAASKMIMNLDADAANDEIYRHVSVPPMAANDVFEVEARFSLADGAGLQDSSAIFGVILTSNAAAGALVDTTFVPKAGAFCGVYRKSDGTGVGANRNWVLYGQGASETAQSRVLDLYPSDGSYQTIRLRLEAGPSTMSLYVMADNDGLSNLKQVRGYRDPPQVPVAYIENITLHAAAQSLIIGHKIGDTINVDMSVDYIAWARART